MTFRHCKISDTSTEGLYIIASNDVLLEKNIFTRKGEKFYFIDLDSIVPVKRYSRGMHYTNHVQLYDSFCDYLGDDMLEPFMAQMLPEGQDYATWVKLIRRGQMERRTRQIETWRKQGRSL